MNKLFLPIMCSALLISGAAMAQDKPLPPPEDAPGPKMEMEMGKKLAEKLNLTEEQQQQAEKIREEGRKKMEPLMEQRKDLREKMKKWIECYKNVI